ncbi:MAG: radical SAM protein [Thermodesulfobacterium sp.]|nr:radical SAM protein [Thermodesulfobacterium sp.]
MAERKTLLFGPVKSRRLGKSLGIEMVPKKVCTMNCIYCEVGKTTDLTLERKEYYPWDLIEKSILQAKELEDTFDVFTFTGSGEPSLNIHFEKAIALAKKIIKKPVAVLTNATLLHISSVRKALAEVDIVLPSLDAGTPETFKKINKPLPQIEFKSVVENLKKLREEMKGEMWLEVLFVKRLNDSEEELKALKSVIDYIKPHKVQLNTVVRPPAFEKAQPVSFEKLEKIAEFLGEKAEIIVHKKKLDKVTKTFKNLEKEKIKEKILNYIKRRPSTVEELSSALGIEKKLIKLFLIELVSEGTVKEKIHEEKTFYLA